MQKWLLATVALLVVGAGIAYWQFRSGVAVEAARVVEQPIREFVDERAQTRLPEVHLVTMPFTARLEPIQLSEGAPVSVGQVVARAVPLDLDLTAKEARAVVDRIDASIRENDDASVEGTALKQSLEYVQSMVATVRAAEQRVKAGKAKFDYATKNFNRIQSLYADRSKSEEEYNQAEVALVQAQVDYQQDQLVLSALGSLKTATALAPTLVRQYIDRKQLARAVLEQEKAQAETRLKQALENQQRGTMKSPVNGVVLERLESSERQVPGGTVLVRIGELERLEVEADILSQDVVRVQPGQPAEVYGPAIGNVPPKTTVSRIYPAGFTKTSSLGVEEQRVRVLLQFPSDELARLREQRNLGVGYRVRARIYTASKSSATVVPRSALFRGTAGGWQVYSVHGSTAQLTPVDVGLMNDELAEITSGLALGDTVILAPSVNIENGTRVRATSVTTPKAAAGPSN